MTHRMTAKASALLLVVLVGVGAACAAQPTVSPQDLTLPGEPDTEPDAQAAAPPAKDNAGGSSGAGSDTRPPTWDAGHANTPSAADASARAGNGSSGSSWQPPGGSTTAPTSSPAPSSTSAPSSTGTGSSIPYPPANVTAQQFCTTYQKYCGFGGMQRYASMTACVMNWNANPQQQGCYNYHLNAAIMGTATLCSSPPTQQCFDIHCPHATGLGGYCS